MAGDLHVTMTGDEARLWRSLQKIVGAEKRVEDGARNVGKAGKSAGDTFSKAFSAVGLGQFASGLGIVLATTRLITAEIRNQLEMQREAATAQTTLAQARQNLIRNLVGASPDVVRDTLAAAKAISGRTATPEKDIANALASALSASGGDVAASKAAVEAAARFLPLESGQVAGFAGSLLDLSGVSKSKDSMTNLGLLLAVGGLGRVVDPQQQARNIPRSLIGQTQFGATASEAAALFAALTVGSGDLTGARSGTAAIGLAEQLRGFKVRDRATRDAWSSMSMGQRIGYLQSTPADAQRFLDKATFEKVAQGPIEGLLLDAASKTAVKFAENLKAIPDAAGLRELAARQIAMQDIDPTMKAARLQNMFTTGTDVIRTSAESEGLQSIIREGTADALKASGQSWTGRKLDTLSMDFWNMATGDPSTIQAEFALRQRRRSLFESAGLARDVEAIDAPYNYSPDLEQRLPASDRAMAEQLRVMIDELRKIDASIREQTRERRPSTLAPLNDKNR